MAEETCKKIENRLKDCKSSFDQTETTYYNFFGGKTEQEMNCTEQEKKVNWFGHVERRGTITKRSEILYNILDEN